MSAYSDLILADEPALYWPLDATDRATDQSGNARNGTAAGGAALGFLPRTPLPDPLAATLRDSYAGKGSQALALADTGQVFDTETVRGNGSIYPDPTTEMSIVSNRLTNTNTTDTTTAFGYAQTEFNSDVRFIGAKFVFTSGGVGGQLVLVVNQTHIDITSSGAGPVPNINVHVTIGPNGWNQAFVENNVGEYVASGLFTLTQDNATEYWAGAIVDGNTLTIRLPDGTVTVVTDPRVASLSGRWATWEVAQGNPSTDAKPKFTEIWAGTDPALTSTDFDGSNDRITSTYNPFTNGTVRTYSGWAYRDNSSTIHTLWGGSNAGLTGSWLFLDNGVNHVSFRVETIDATGASWAAWLDAWPGNSQWVHWALVFDEPNNNAELFINGTTKGVVGGLTQTYQAGSNFDLGAIGGIVPFDGRMAHVAVFDHALTPSEIESHHALGVQGAVAQRGWLHEAGRAF